MLLQALGLVLQRPRHFGPPEPGPFGASPGSEGPFPNLQCQPWLQASLTRFLTPFTGKPLAEGTRSGDQGSHQPRNHPGIPTQP